MSVIAGIIREKCPKCGTGDVFIKKGNPLTFTMPKMHSHCPVCNHKFEKEPGYFFGSMFISYAITVAEMIILIALTYYVIESFVTIIVLVGLMAILLSTFNFRLSRMIWMYMFDGKDREM